LIEKSLERKKEQTERSEFLDIFITAYTHTYAFKNNKKSKFPNKQKITKLILNKVETNKWHQLTHNLRKKHQRSSLKSSLNRNSAKKLKSFSKRKMMISQNFNKKVRVIILQNA